MQSTSTKSISKIPLRGLLGLVVAFALCAAAAAQQPSAAPAPAQPAATGQSPSTPANSGVVGDHNARYTDRIPPEQIITLEAAGDKFLARYIADLSGQTRGAVIILHDSGQHPSWPLTAAALIDDLPLHGWDTLNIELPAPAPPGSGSAVKIEQPAVPSANGPATTASAAAGAQPAAGNATAPAAAPSQTPAIEPQAQARIGAALKHFSDRQHNIALIGFGSGAIRAAEMLRQMMAASASNTDPVTALVMIAPVDRLEGIEFDLPKILPSTSVPALDLLLDNEPQTRADAEARRRAVLHQRTRVYTQLVLPPLNGASSPQRSVMVKRVRAWLQQHAHPSTNKKEENKTPIPTPAAN